MNVGRAIKLCRNMRELSQQELADKAGLALSYISLIENNKREPTISTINRIAAAVDVQIGCFFYLILDKSELDELGSDLSSMIAAATLDAIKQE